MATRAAADPAVVHVNLGDAIDLTDERLAYDGMHLTGAGNAVIADALVEAGVEAGEGAAALSAVLTDQPGRLSLAAYWELLDESHAA